MGSSITVCSPEDGYSFRGNKNLLFIRQKFDDSNAFVTAFFRQFGVNTMCRLPIFFTLNKPTMKKTPPQKNTAGTLKTKERSKLAAT